MAEWRQRVFREIPRRIGSMVSLRAGAIVLAALLAVAGASAQQRTKGRVFTNDDVERSSPAPSAPIPDAAESPLDLGRIATAEPQSPESLLSTADSVFEEMSRLTGLAIRAPLKKRVVNRTEMRQFLEDTLHAEYTPQMIHEQEASVKAFGVVPPDFDMAKFVVNFYTEQAAGLYDSRSKTMLLADWVEPEVQQMVLRHELTHALQDQNFDLDRFMKAVISNDDATNARQAVAEGYATATMFQSALGGMDLADIPGLGSLLELGAQQQFAQLQSFMSAPFFLRYQAMFPYTQGLLLMQQGLAQGGWARLNQMFLKPPETTREVFHPELYYSGNAAGHDAMSGNLPRPKPLSNVPDLHFVYENTMGELGYYALIGQFISEEEAASVAPDLTGDRYLVYENSSAHRFVLVAATKWTSPEAAQKFFGDYQTILAKKFPGITPDRRSTPDQFIGSVNAAEILLLRKGNECLWAEGVPTSQTNAMLDYLRSIQ